LVRTREAIEGEKREVARQMTSPCASPSC
jgi:hypothetical protein